ncbi:hypothetical protein IGI04_040648 [Brassica rapa subsp. trilocularis]|uniref:Uncharacterized protein n=1 Tax=Brassica rapa subsp. trilocularis TaxID=1813537 RepID=A0ABQ7KP69_BRACM|nr:hypothetical protein IGI04_040648 [Brassica rapa subsp. trilocularis]
MNAEAYIFRPITQNPFSLFKICENVLLSLETKRGNKQSSRNDRNSTPSSSCVGDFPPLTRALHNRESAHLSDCSRKFTYRQKKAHLNGITSTRSSGIMPLMGKVQRLRVGGRPPGSGDGTATVCYCHGLRKLECGGKQSCLVELNLQSKKTWVKQPVTKCQKLYCLLGQLFEDGFSGICES